MTGFQLLIWIGALVTLASVAGLGATAYGVWKLRRSDLADDALRRALQRMVLRNMVALLAAVLGLMMVIMGIVLP